MISTIHMGYSHDDSRITFRVSALPLVYCSPPDLPGLAGLDNDSLVSSWFPNPVESG